MAGMVDGITLVTFRNGVAKSPLVVFHIAIKPPNVDDVLLQATKSADKW